MFGYVAKPHIKRRIKFLFIYLSREAGKKPHRRDSGAKKLILLSKLDIWGQRESWVYED